VSEAEQLAAELEWTIDQLGSDTWADDPEWCRARLAEFYDGGIAAFGPSGPDGDALREAQLWFLLDCPLPSGDTPLWRLAWHRSERAVELLGRSEIRAWRIESVAGPRLLSASCPRTGAPARVEPARPPRGLVRAGALAVARSVPLGAGRWLLLGAASVVVGPRAVEFERLLRSLDAPPGQFWFVHGGVLARAAAEWLSGAEAVAA
jgi:hypothetical protein